MKKVPNDYNYKFTRYLLGKVKGTEGYAKLQQIPTYAPIID